MPISGQTVEYLAHFVTCRGVRPDRAKICSFILTYPILIEQENHHQGLPLLLFIDY